MAETPVLRRDLLQRFVLGNPVAEFDKGLSSYFVITDAFNRLVTGSADMITGGKGTGKTAIYRYLQQCQPVQLGLADVHIISGINPSGEPLFRRFGEEEKLTEGQYVTIWKLYFISLIGNYLVKSSPRLTSKTFLELEALLSKLELLSNDSSAGSVFPRLMGWLRNQVRPKAIGLDITFNEYGFPVYSPKIEFGQADRPSTNGPEKDPGWKVVPHREVFRLLESILAEKKMTVWIIMDRLDESFIGRPDIEINALRALFRSFMDLTEYQHIKIKLFVRTDLFRKVIQGGFVNLTHITARKTEIIWDDEDLLALLCQRIRNNTELLRSIGLQRIASNLSLVRSIFSEKIDPNRGQQTWKWMLSQVRDGTGVKAPRNLIDLCVLAQEEQLRKDRREATEYVQGTPLVEADSIKKASVRLSKMRLDDTLLAEYANDVKVLVNAFRGSRAEHNDQSIAVLLHVDVERARLYARSLLDIGFFEAVGDTYKIPFLYRASLGITQGKAFNGTTSRS